MQLIWPIQLLRILASLLVTVLFVPMLKTFLYAYSCHDVPWICVPGSQSLYSAAAAVGICLLLPFYFLIVAAYYDPNPASEKMTAKAHTYTDLILALTKTVLSVLVVLSTDKKLIAFAFVILTLIMVAAAVILQPYYTQGMNLMVR